ncbi:MAG: protein kinase [Elusimicrobiota bacterium]|jgi:serine/threonine protein kinase|nr:protein kinase [Elusimicrobiota bacterium]
MSGTANNELKVQSLINGQYALFRQIGKGAFGVVWQSYDFSLKNFIAIKELLPKYSEPKFIEMFYKEALISKNISHENIIRVHNFWKGNNGSYYIAMDFIKGVNLEQVIKKCNQLGIKIPWHISALITTFVLKALDYANRVAADPITGKPYGLLHRDISTSNVMVLFEGNVKLGDFGVAKTVEEVNRGITDSVIVGKYQYMSPEQIMGEPDIDNRCDIFSVALVFYEMLTGQPFYSGDKETILSDMSKKEFHSSCLDNLNVPKTLGEIISKALAKDKNKRYEKALTMYLEIKKTLQSYETENIMEELSVFLSSTMKEEIEILSKTSDFIKILNKDSLDGNPEVNKIICRNFIAGSTSSQISQEQMSIKEQQILEESSNIEYDNEEEKGKTIFEDAGYWLQNKFDLLRRKIIKMSALCFSILLAFVAVDIGLQITTVGKSIYFRFNPPELIISTKPLGAKISISDSSGEVIMKNVSTNVPIPIKNVKLGGTYVITAMKDGFKTVRKAVRIDKDARKKGKPKSEKINILFDFEIEVNSQPQGADVYIDGNKVSETPCKIQLSAGEHTIRLSLNGFENLGNDAKESKDGMCNLDLLKPSVESIFEGVDVNFWDVDIRPYGDEKVFSLRGRLYKKFAFYTVPAGMSVQIGNDSKIYNTELPLTVDLKEGVYDVKIFDPKKRFNDVYEKIVISTSTINELNVVMGKEIAFSAQLNGPKKSTKIFLTVKSDNLRLNREFTQEESVTIPLTVGKYDFIFEAEGYEKLTMRNVDISKTNKVKARLYPLKSSVVFYVYYTPGGKRRPVKNAFIWFGNRIAGRTDASGIWSGKTDASSLYGKVVARGFNQEEFDLDVEFGVQTKKEVKLTVNPLGTPLDYYKRSDVSYPQKTASSNVKKRTPSKVKIHTKASKTLRDLRLSLQESMGDEDE